MDASNTSPSFFLLLALIQPAAALLLSPMLSPRFQVAAAACIGSHWGGYIIALMLGSHKFFDITEDISYLLIFFGIYRSIEMPSTRQTIVFMLGMFWCVRICSFVGYRIIVRGHDWRFDKLSTGKAYSFFAWTCGGTWCWLNGFALWYLADSPGVNNGDLGTLDVCGLALSVSGFLIENVADIQKYNFNKGVAYDSNKEWIASGLWSWSRHPNYCGEIMIWTGLAMTCLSGLQGLSLGACALTAVTPVWSFFFLVFTSLMLLEKRADAKWGGVARYQEYKRKTPVLFPGM
jgi:steroid 5-alpha reductase family enzyme